MIEHDENEIPKGKKRLSDKEIKKMVDDFLEKEFKKKKGRMRIESVNSFLKRIIKTHKRNIL